MTSQKQACLKNLPRILILRGPPGVGKSTVAQKVISLVPSSKVALVSIDVLQHMDRRNVSRDKLKLGIYHAVLICRSFAREGFTTVVEYTFDRDLDFFLEKIFQPHSGPPTPCLVQLFYLDAQFDIVARRNASRPDPMPVSTLRKIYGETDSGKGNFSECLIDTSPRTMSSKRIATTILAYDKALVGINEVVNVPALRVGK
jgi:hypothetical protein